MDPTTTFVADVTVALIVGSIAGSIARVLRITPIIGYIAAGVVIGPFTPGYVTHSTSLSGLAELGLIFLLFSLGLSFSLRELTGVGVAPLAGNVIAMACSGAGIWIVCAALHVPHPITLALAFTVSSTAVGAALMQTLGIAGKTPGTVALTLLIVQDLISVLLLVVISTPANELSLAGLTLPLIRALLFVVVALVLGATLLHRLFTTTLQRAGTDLLVVIFSAVALAAAWLGHWAGLTFEFGAFVAGAVTSEAAGSHMVQSVVRPFRELFIMLFFVSMGTLVDLSSAIAHWNAVLAVACAAIVLRWLLWTGVARSVRMSAAAAIAFGITLLPMAEFNIVLAQASFAAGRLNRTEMTILVAACMLSILASAIPARLIGTMQSRREPIRPSLQPLQKEATVAIIGYGRVGATATSMLLEANIPVIVVDHDAGLVREAADAGADAVYGDGADPHVLSHIVSPRTHIVLTTVPDARVNAAIARWLSERDVDVIIARVNRADEVPSLIEAGASAAMVPEIEGARAFGSLALAMLTGDPIASAKSKGLQAGRRRFP